MRDRTAGLDFVACDLAGLLTALDWTLHITEWSLFSLWERSLRSEKEEALSTLMENHNQESKEIYKLKNKPNHRACNSWVQS